MPDRVLVIMGVSGTGKSTIGKLLAERLGWDFAEGDAMHPPENVAKMASGHPLTDEDRQPWLAKVQAWIDDHTTTGRPGVITCSALKHSYRDMLRGDGVTFIFLSGTPDLIGERLHDRQHEYMPPSLVDSQFETLEPPTPDEHVVTVDVADPPAEIVREVLRAMGLTLPLGHRPG